MVGQMQVQTQVQRNTITLQGSAQIVSEFFQYAVNKYVMFVKKLVHFDQDHPVVLYVYLNAVFCISEEYIQLRPLTWQKNMGATYG